MRTFFIASTLNVKTKKKLQLSPELRRGGKKRNETRHTTI